MALCFTNVVQTSNLKATDNTVVKRIAEGKAFQAIHKRSDFNLTDQHTP